MFVRSWAGKVQGRIDDGRGRVPDRHGLRFYRKSILAPVIGGHHAVDLIPLYEIEALKGPGCPPDLDPVHEPGILKC